MRKKTCSKCDNLLTPNRVGKYAYCNPCHAEYMRLTRPKHSELNPEAKMKANARSYAHVYRDRGYIAKSNCIECGSPDSQMHHEDYSKPIDVTWLCRPCHLKIHRISI
jgi:hypothetical protein